MVCELEHLTEGLVESLVRHGLTTVRPGEDGVLRVAIADRRAERLPTGAQAVRQIGTDEHEPRFPKFAAPHRHHLFGEIDIPIMERHSRERTRITG